MAVLTLPGVKRFWKNVKEYIDSRISASQNTFPTKVSDLQNDAGYYNQSTLPAINNGILTIQKNGQNVSTFSANQSSNATANIQVPTKVSELQNDSGFLTEHQDLSNFATKQEISNLIDSAPTTLDTLKELADAIGNNPDFASTIATQIASKADDSDTVHKSGTETIPGEKEFVLPIKGSVTGNAGTADEFKSEKYIDLSGDVTGSAYSKGDWALTTSLAPSGVSEGVYGQLADVLDTKSLDIKIPEITVDSKGRITNIVDRNVTATIPTKVSELQNDSGFLTSQQSKADLGLENVQNIDQSKAIKTITRNGTTFTYACLDGTTGTFTQQDTTYSNGSNLSLSNNVFSLNNEISVTSVSTTNLIVNGWTVTLE